MKVQELEPPFPSKHKASTVAALSFVSRIYMRVCPLLRSPHDADHDTEGSISESPPFPETIYCTNLDWEGTPRPKP